MKTQLGDAGDAMEYINNLNKKGFNEKQVQDVSYNVLSAHKTGLTYNMNIDDS